MAKKVLILGAAGRDFHNFNTFFRDNDEWQVVAFTATQIPNIDGRKYPAELAGSLYPDGIPIVPESELTALVKEHNIDYVVFAYSDVTYDHVMTLANEANAAGANYLMLGTRDTQVKSTKPVVSVTAIRTGCGKSQTTRYVCDIFKEMGKKVVAIRHPMPYGDLVKQKVQRFAEYPDLDKHECTIEEREEYEPHIDNDEVVYAGVDYEAIVREAEKEADIVMWDGGNNDFSFYKPDFSIVVVDPHRAGHELKYHPSAVNLRTADAIVINKMDTAEAEGVEIVKANVAKYNPSAKIIECDSPVTVDDPDAIKGKKVLVVEDGPTLTHGEMTFGAGVVAAKKFGAAEIVDPRPFTVGEITETYKKYPKIGMILPAMGYGDKQVKDLQETIDKSDCDLVVAATPIDLTRIIKVNKPMVRVKYALAERTKGELKSLLEKF